MFDLALGKEVNGTFFGLGKVYLREHGSNVSPGPAAVEDKHMSIKSIVMIMTEIKHPTWSHLSISQTDIFWSVCDVCESEDEELSF